MKKSELEAILKVGTVKGAPSEKYARFVPPLADLYNAGCSVKQLEQLFGVSKKFIRTHLARAEVTFRAPGPREAATVPAADRIIAVLKKHGLKLDDLPGPKGSASSKPKPKRGA
jgi:hypothetical protein